MSKKRYSVKIDDKTIGCGNPIYITAEIGINHNGDMALCKNLIDMASSAGCDAVKFQKRTIELVYNQEELAKPREISTEYLEKAIERGIFSDEELKRIKISGTTNGDQKKVLEFGKKEYMEIDRYCKERKITWFASPWDLKSVDFLKEFDVPCYKIPSALLTYKDMLEKIKKIKKPIILSTGMSTSQQIRKSINFLGEKNLILLSCVSTYPTMNIAEQNLGWIGYFKKKYSCPIGYSGHEPNTKPTIIAMALGAEMVERHITITRTLWGSDQASSLEKQGLEKIIQYRNEIPILIGKSKKHILESETPIMRKLRKYETL